MASADMVRAWKDPDFHPDHGYAPHPAGDIDLGQLAGADLQPARTEYIATLGCCGGFTSSYVCWLTSPFPPGTCQFVPTAGC